MVKNYREGSSPEKTALEVADGFKMPVGNSVGCAVAQATKASAPRPPGIADRIKPVQAVFAVTMEILPSARASSWRAQHLNRRWGHRRWGQVLVRHGNVANTSGGGSRPGNC